MAKFSFKASKELSKAHSGQLNGFNSQHKSLHDQMGTTWDNPKCVCSQIEVISYRIWSPGDALFTKASAWCFWQTTTG